MVTLSFDYNLDWISTRTALSLLGHWPPREALDLGNAVGCDYKCDSTDSTSSTYGDEDEMANLLIDVQDEKASLEIIERLIRGGLDANVCVDLQGNTALHHACSIGSQDQVRLLLSLNADPNICNDDKEPPLLYAYSNRMNEMTLSALNDLDADFDLCDEDEMSPLRASHANVSETAADLIKLLLEHGADPSVILHAAVSNRDNDIIRLLHEAHAELDGHGVHRTTPLQVALRQGRDSAQINSTVMLLLKLRANPNTPDAKGQLPLMIAIESKKTELVQLLLNCKANPNESSRRSFSPMERTFLNHDYGAACLPSVVCLPLRCFHSLLMIHTHTHTHTHTNTTHHTPSSRDGPAAA
jgi:ankyrin repeat protein